jgi:ribonuclease HII
MVKVLGIDEAGRGPVIGPMVMAGIMIEEGDEALLEGAKDSKLVLHKIRLQLDKKFKESEGVDYKVLVVEPEIIDAAVLSGELNLNWLEAHKQAEIINELQPDKAIIDCPSINCESYEKYLRALLDNKEMNLIVEHKADVNYITAAAASILAKVERENQMEIIKQKYGDCGPGYPANKKTQDFVKNNWDKYPEIFRKSWSTYKRFARPEGQKSLTGYEI